MKFRIYNNQIIRNEMAYVGGHYPLFSMGDNIDNYATYPSQEVSICVLAEFIDSFVRDNYIIETWKLGDCNEYFSSVHVIKPVGYDAIPAELVYAERYDEI